MVSPKFHSAMLGLFFLILNFSRSLRLRSVISLHMLHEINPTSRHPWHYGQPGISYCARNALQGMQLFSPCKA